MATTLGAALLSQFVANRASTQRERLGRMEAARREAYAAYLTATVLDADLTDPVAAAGLLRREQTAAQAVLMLTSDGDLFNALTEFQAAIQHAGDVDPFVVAMARSSVVHAMRTELGVEFLATEVDRRQYLGRLARTHLHPIRHPRTAIRILRARRTVGVRGSKISGWFDEG